MPAPVPTHLDEMEPFLKDVIEATVSFTPVYKLNMAFYERYGSRGYAVMERLVETVDGRALTIADGKRGDIGNTSRQYARSIFETIGFDAVTVAPYMGRDSIEPFIENPEKGVFVLCLTSNNGADDFQYLEADGISLYQYVARLVLDLNIHNNLGLVVGATRPEAMSRLRSETKGLSWLIPGIGAQGGDLGASIEIGNKTGTAVINVSRGILYAGNVSLDDVSQAAQSYTNQIRAFL